MLKLKAKKNGSNQKSSTPEKSGASGRVEGEGSYSATRAYNQHIGKALSDKKSIERGAEKARKALEGPEGPSLRDAEKRAKSGPRGAKAARAR